eukprot:comp23444_c0_seq1/m.39108 comp23444_c0_seq1/g.39108  ORF comp23444_c0_seq1/g.39108 comp23444_c0_seq1/m.39108 type:complete len:164 (-) comp23444_c0_seq1:469-960(-)
MSEQKTRRILLPDDGSEYSRHALEWAVENISRPGDSFVLLQSFQVPTAPSIFIPEVDIVVDEHLDTVRDQLKAAVEDRLNSLARFLEPLKYPSTVVAVEGDPRDVIISAISEYDIDMVVMGSRGKGALTRMFIGSTSDYVVHQAKIPVIVVHPETNEDSRKDA